MTTPSDSYAWNYRELTTLLTLSESLAEVGLEPLTIGSIRKSLTIEISWHPILKYLMEYMPLSAPAWIQNHRMIWEIQRMSFVKIWWKYSRTCYSKMHYIILLSSIQNLQVRLQLIVVIIIIIIISIVITIWMRKKKKNVGRRWKIETWWKYKNFLAVCVELKQNTISNGRMKLKLRETQHRAITRVLSIWATRLNYN